MRGFYWQNIRNGKTEYISGNYVNRRYTMKEGNIILNDIEYTPVIKNGNAQRAIVVVDRGWIFAGDVEEENGRIRLTRAVWVFRWTEIGFAGVIENPEKADIRPIADVDIPVRAEIYRIPVEEDWGL